MVPIAANHAPNIVNRDFLPLLVADMLPTRNFLEDQQTKFVACVQEIRRLRVVRCPHNVALEFPFQDVSIAPLPTGSHRLTNKRKCLMSVESAQFNDLPVEFETMIGEAGITKTEAAAIFVDDRVVLL